MSAVLSGPARHLVFHGSLVLLFGLCLGAPYARAIRRGASPHIVNAWRVAHASLPMGALLMFAVAAVLPLLDVGEAFAWAMALILIASGYAFCVSTALAALTGQRGLDRHASHGLGRLVWAVNLLGASTSLLAAVLLVVAAWLSLG